MAAFISVFSSLAIAQNAQQIQLTNEKWAMVSIPGDPGNTGTVAELFGDDLPVNQYGIQWIMFRYGSAGYEELTTSSRLLAGEAYWLIQATGQTVVVDVPSTISAPDTNPLRGCYSIVGCFTVDLDTTNNSAGVRWNMVGLSQPDTVDLSTIRVLTEDGACKSGCSMDEAFDEDILLNSWFSLRDESAQYVQLAQTDTSVPWDGFWVGVLSGGMGQNVSLQVPRALPAPQTPNLDDYERVFNDDFDGPVLDSSLWNTGLLWGPYVIINREEQLYVDQLGMHEGFSYEPFSFTPEGTLKITAMPVSEVGPPPPMPDADAPIWDEYLEYRAPNASDPQYVESNVNYLSGLMNTYEGFKFTHGYVETRAKVPKGQGLWPAFWMLPTHYVEDVPEIDIMEYIGQFPNEAYHTFHYFDPSDNWRKISTPTFETIGPDFSERFHEYSMSWDPEQIIWYVDGVETRRISTADWDIPNQAMFLLANVAVGGSWPRSPDATTEFPAVMEMDYIRVYKRKVERPVNLADYKLMFSDEFDGSTLNADKWETRFIWGPFLTINNEKQHYIDSNGIDADLDYSPFTVADGHLTITAAVTDTQTPANSVPPAYPASDDYWSDKPGDYRSGYVPKEYTSGIITSRDSFAFAHGYAEMSAKIPAIDGMWPAFWLLNKYYVGPQPEIDIMEIIGEDPGTVVHTYHWRNAIGAKQQRDFRSQGGSNAEGFGDDFHTFGVQWSHDTITWYVDGVETASLTDPEVAYQIMYVLANLAVGGDFTQADIARDELPAEFVIDYIRIYQEKPLP